MENIKTENNEEITEPDFLLDFDSSYFSGKEINLERLELMDKNKEAKQLHYQIIRQQMRQKTKDKRVKAKQNKKAKLSQMTKEERILFHNTLDKKKSDEKEHALKSMSSQYNIIIDLEYVNLMKSREIKSLSSQIGYCYNMNKTGISHFAYHLCGMTGVIKDALQIMGSDSWFVHKRDEFFYETPELMSREVIYLSPDSDNVLTSVEKDVYYVIGGFVDKPVVKYRSLEKAKELNIKTARLPLEEYVDNLINPVLNVNTVAEILGRFITTNDWRLSINLSLPKRMVDVK